MWGSARPADVHVFVDAQRWLATGGIRAVLVPYAGLLARALPNGDVRMRRDFEQLLTCI
jgi:hypothetical protein